MVETIRVFSIPQEVGVMGELECGQIPAIYNHMAKLEGRGGWSMATWRN